jgi:hypothetical protein
MAQVKPAYRLGRIIGAYLRSKKGRRQLHPAIILSPDAEIVQPELFDPRRGGDNVVAVLGISTKYRVHPEPYLRLPFHPTGHPVTGLNQDCAAIVGWYDVISIPDDVRFWAGDVPAELMVRLNDAVRRDIIARLGHESKSVAEMISLLFPE